MIIVFQEKIILNNLFQRGGGKFAIAPPILGERGVHLTPHIPPWIQAREDYYTIVPI